MPKTLAGNKVRPSMFGADGLTKDQRYYQAHPEVKIKNRERERRRRDQAREQRLLEASAGANEQDTSPSLTASFPPTTVVTATNDVAVLSNVQSPLPTTVVTATNDVAVLSNVPSTTTVATATNVADSDVAVPSNVPSALPVPTVKANADGPVPSYLPTDFLYQRTRVWAVRDKTMDDALDRLREMREEVVQWSRGWGGIDCWSVQLDYSYQHALEDEGPLTPRWRESMFRHARGGRQMLEQLRQFDHDLPEERWLQEEIWRMRVELAEKLVKGVTILEIKASILPGVCNVDHCCGSDDDESAQATDKGDSDSDGTYQDGNGSGDDGIDDDDDDGLYEGDEGFEVASDIDADGETDDEE
ncbi:hypothetical protein H0H93_012106 [Arthromyces matolae]|nr:hypothetical protein H0H93_012106 [Arthromyces matolae]